MYDRKHYWMPFYQAIYSFLVDGNYFLIFSIVKKFDIDEAVKEGLVEGNDNEGTNEVVGESEERPSEKKERIMKRPKLVEYSMIRYWVHKNVL